MRVPAKLPFRAVLIAACTTATASLATSISAESEHLISRLAVEAIERPLGALRWDGVNLSSISASTRSSFVVGGPTEVLTELQDPVVMGLGCAAAALRLSHGNWSRYHTLGATCWPAMGFSASKESQSFFLPPIDLRTVARMSGQFKARSAEVASALRRCVQAEPDSEKMMACVLSSMGDTFADLDAAIGERLGVTVPPYASAMALTFAGIAWVALAVFVWNTKGALVWIVLTLVVCAFTMALAFYQVVALCFDIILFTLLRFYSKIIRRLSALSSCCIPNRSRMILLKQLRSAQTYEEWLSVQQQLERLASNSLPGKAALVAGKENGSIYPNSDDGQGKLCRKPSFPCCTRRIPEEPLAQTDEDLLRENIASLSSSISNSDVNALLLTLRGQLTRNHAGIDESNASGSKWSPKPLALEYMKSLEHALNFVADSDTDQSISLEEKLRFFKHCQQTVGTTALCLSGGGSLAMYHMGICKELIQQGLLPSVISGTSGGSIVVGFLALYTDEELLRDIFVDDISTRYPERWFPGIWEEIVLFMQKRVLVRTEDFAKTTRRYFGETTFGEAYAYNGRNCSITISTYSSQGGRTGASLLLNHMTAPHVTISSAVAASCALPGIMGPHRLMAKTPDGKLQPFDSGGREFVDGTLRADLPKRRLAEMFHCNQFMVSQVNPHIAPFLRRSERHKDQSLTSGRTLLRKIEDWMAIDIRHRTQVLTKFGLMPTILGIDLVPVLKQNYGQFGSGVMFVPDCIHISDALNATRNPTVQDMQHYLYQGQRCIWDKAEQVRHILLVENTLNACMARLEKSAGSSFQKGKTALSAVAAKSKGA